MTGPSGRQIWANRPQSDECSSDVLTSVLLVHQRIVCLRFIRSGQIVLHSDRPRTQ